jgi:hypothetical protein
VQQPQPGTRRQFRRAAAAGSAVALLLDLLLLLGPGGSIVAREGILGGFFDAQARAFLDGSLAVPPEAVGLEGFVVDGRTYQYFGPVLALLRVPVLMLTDALDGRLTRISLALAVVVLLVATAALHWRVRSALRGEAPLGGNEGAFVGLLQVALGAGSIVLYLVARPVVYHETELWGAAFAVASLWAVMGVLAAPSGRRIALAGLLAVLTINTRVSVGLVPLAALAVAFVVLLLGARDRRLLVGVAAAALVALGSSAAVNVAKFGSPFGIPIDRQVASQVDPERRAALAANHGTLFGAQFVPTTLLAAVRPDAVGTVRAAPWVGLPAAPPHVVGDVRFDTLQRSLSAPTSMGLLCLLTLGGLVALVRARRWALLALLGAAATGGVGMLTIGYVTSRYLADLLPLLVLGGVVGVQALAGRGRIGAPFLAVALVLVAVGVLVNGGAGLLEQRLAASPVSEAQRANWVRTQDRVDDALGRSARGVSRGATLPASTAGRRVGDLAVVGACEGLYVLDTFGDWAPVERTARTGLLELEVRGVGDREAVLAVLGRGAERVTLVARRGAAGLQLAVRALARDQPFGAPVPTGPVARVALDVGPGFDGRSLATARVGAHDAASVGLPRAPAGARIAGDAGVPSFAGSVRRVAQPTPVCSRFAPDR